MTTDLDRLAARYTTVVGECDAPEWDTPVPLDTGAVPPFPVGALPDVFRDYVSALAAFTRASMAESRSCQFPSLRSLSKNL